MATKGKRWPQNAEAARMETLALGREIQARAVEAMGERRNWDMVLVMLREIRGMGELVELRMRLAKHGERVD